ncbi:MAG TPA: metallophosphoesterase [Chloroflexia bacterium]|nr:metallophosphoesterase [Chloroflexia bacterium]
MLNYVFNLFSLNIWLQLQLLSPVLALGAGFTLLAVLGLRQQLKQYRLLLGRYIMISLVAYGLFCLLMLALQPLGISYGAAQPVIVVFGALYFLAFGSSLLVTVVLFNFIALRKRWRRASSAYALVHLAIIGLLFYAFYIEPFWIDVTYTTIQSAKLPSGAQPVRIALISDIHMEKWTRREDAAVAKLAEIKPDLILISGDHINIDHYHTPETYTDMHRFFKSLHAGYGVYAVAGTVDNIEVTRSVMASTEVRLLDDEATTIEVHGQRLSLVGVKSTFFDKQEDVEILKRVTGALPSDSLHVLLYHMPDIVPEAVDSGIDLYLAGHTHGGQIALPFFGALFTASASGRQYAAGLYDLKGLQQAKLYVTRGLGMEGVNTPRARLFARPELSVITLAGAK